VFTTMATRSAQVDPRVGEGQRSRRPALTAVSSAGSSTDSTALGFLESRTRVARSVIRTSTQLSLPEVLRVLLNHPVSRKLTLPGRVG